jgi:hypothetical protein
MVFEFTSTVDSEARFFFREAAGSKIDSFGGTARTCAPALRRATQGL